MARPKKQNPILNLARRYLQDNLPELNDSLVQVRALEGPPGSPRFTASVELCTASECPHNVPKSVAEAGECPVHCCDLRHAVRLLLDRDGNIIKETHSGIHWNVMAPRPEDD
jgi:hypothetical protein